MHPYSEINVEGVHVPRRTAAKNRVRRALKRHDRHTVTVRIARELMDEEIALDNEIDDFNLLSDFDFDSDYDWDDDFNHAFCDADVEELSDYADDDRLYWYGDDF